MTALRFNWSANWPNAPGTYLFSGRPRGTRSFDTMLVAVAPDSTGSLVFIGGGHILYKVEWEGVWAPFDLQEPNAEQLLSEAGE